jgi:hypothetical protein
VNLAKRNCKVKIGILKINKTTVMVPHCHLDPAQLIYHRIELRNVIQVHVTIGRRKPGTFRIQREWNFGKI